MSSNFFSFVIFYNTKAKISNMKSTTLIESTENLQFLNTISGDMIVHREALTVTEQSKE